MNSVSPLLLVSVSVNGYDMYQQAPPYVMVELVSRVDYGYDTIEKLALTAVNRRINVSFMNISQSQGAEN